VNGSAGAFACSFFFAYVLIALIGEYYIIFPVAKPNRRYAKNKNPLRNILIQCLGAWAFELESGECCQCENIQFQCCQFPIGNWYWLWQHFHTGNIYKCWSWRVELEIGTTDLHGQGFAYARPFGELILENDNAVSQPPPKLPTAKVLRARDNFQMY